MEGAPVAPCRLLAPDGPESPGRAAAQQQAGQQERRSSDGSGAEQSRRGEWRMAAFNWETGDVSMASGLWGLMHKLLLEPGQVRGRSRGGGLARAGLLQC